MAEDLLQELTAGSEGRDSPTSQLAFVANDSDENQKLAKKVMRDVTGAMGGVNKQRSGIREDNKYYFGHQWPDLDRMRMEQLRRPALTFNEIGPKIDAVSGIERMNRTEVRFVSRPLDSDAMHDAAGDLATESVATVEDNCDGEMEDSQAVKDALIGGLGLTEIFMDYQLEEDGVVEKRHIDNMEYVWDQKARKPNLADRQWDARIKNYSRKDFKKRWPGKIEIIDSSAVMYQEDTVGKYELVTPYYSLSNERANPSLDVQPTTALANIPVIHYEWIDDIDIYRIADPTNPDQLVTLTAEQWAATKKKAALGGQPPPKAVRQLKGIYKQVYVALGTVLEEPSVIPDFTRKPITGQWDSEKKVWYGLVRGLKDPQSTMNKAISSLVTQYITNSKGGVIFKTGTFADSSMAKNQWAQPDAWIEANPQADLQRDIMHRPSTDMSPFPTMLFQESKQSMTRISGVTDEMAGTATGEQTGPTIDRRMQAALAILGWLWDNVQRYKKDVAHTELEFIREYWSHGQFVNVGGNFNSQSIPLLKSDLPIHYNMVMDQSVRYNPNLKAQLWQDLMQIAGPLMKTPAGQQIMLKGLKYSTFPSQLVQEIQQATQEAQQGQQQQQKGRGKQEDPEFTQAKIKKMGAETERTMAETRKLDSETQMGGHKLAIDAQMKRQQLQHQQTMNQHKVLSDRVKHAQQMQNQQQKMAMDQQQQAMQNRLQMIKATQPQPEAGPNQEMAPQ